MTPSRRLALGLVVTLGAACGTGPTPDPDPVVRIMIARMNAPSVALTSVTIVREESLRLLGRPITASGDMVTAPEGTLRRRSSDRGGVFDVQGGQVGPIAIFQGMNRGTATITVTSRSGVTGTLPVTVP